MKKLIVVVTLMYCSLLSYGINTNLGLKLEFGEETHNEIKIGFEHKKGNFLADMSATFLNDDKYQMDQWKDSFDYYYIIDKSYIGYSFSDGLSVKVGRIIQEDDVKTPYSLMVSSKKSSASGAEISYEDDKFFYKSRWFKLNENSAFGFPDRGGNYKVYGFKYKNWRVAYQDAVLYVGDTYEAEYFFSPAPVYLVNEITEHSSTPWEEDTNRQALMGCFVDKTEDNSYFYLQLLVDDMNANRVANPDDPQNPDKIAWSIGYKKEFSFGKLGFYHAGATKFTFEPYGGEDGDGNSTDTRYGYTYFPDNEYDGKGIDYEENYIGYKYGEDNMAFLVDYEVDYKEYNIINSFEVIFNGAKSPNNPWQEYKDYKKVAEGTKLLGNGPIEKKILYSIDVKKEIKKDLEIMAELEVGRVIHKMELVDVEEELRDENNKIKIFRPSNENSNLFKFGVGIKIKI